MSVRQSDKVENTEEPVGLDRGIERLESRRASKEEKRIAGALKGQRVRGWTEKLLTRTLSGFVYVVIIIACLFAGIIPTAVLLSAMGWLCCSEFFRICRMAGRRPNEFCGLAAALAYPILSALFGATSIVAVTCILALLVCVWYVFNPRSSIGDVAITVFGPLYASLMLSSLSLIRASNPGMDGTLLSLLVIGSMWVEDSCAYLVGSSIGTHKMAPRISPNKSWEGFFGGMVGCVLVWCVGAFFHVGGLTWSIAIICGLAEGVVAVLGDLFESRIKRSVGVKDSGNLLPGHGGLLDRTDSMLFGGTVAYFILLFGGII